ncbi:MAG: hypothetical protein IKS22_09815 [Bacteroidales bacterium]|nr:hypothetical protein [Bacteroidales bacterium]
MSIVFFIVVSPATDCEDSRGSCRPFQKNPALSELNGKKPENGSGAFLMQSKSMSIVKDTESFVYTISSGEVFSIIEPVLLVKPSQLSLCGHAQIKNQCDFSFTLSKQKNKIKYWPIFKFREKISDPVFLARERESLFHENPSTIK